MIIKRIIGLFLAILISYLLSLIILFNIATSRLSFITEYSKNRVEIYKNKKLIAYEKRGTIDYVRINFMDRIYVVQELNKIKEEILEEINNEN